VAERNGDTAFGCAEANQKSLLRKSGVALCFPPQSKMFFKMP
jgi:hypothetical protein